MRVIAAALQPSIELAFPGSGPLDEYATRRNAQHCAELMRSHRSHVSTDLFVLPEFFLTGYTLGRTIADWIDASITIPGSETDILSEAAVAAGAYVAGAAYEKIAAFPARFFNTAFIIAPNGDVVLSYRKLYAMTPKTRPGDVLDKWLDLFGTESLFPVADTEIGRLGALVARDVHWPEVARCLALRGAEILINPNAAGPEAQDGGIYMRQARAYENHCYLITANIGPFVESGVADEQPRAPTEIIDFRGRVVAHAETEKETIVGAELDLTSLRQTRISGEGKGNMIAQLQPRLHAEIYDRARLFPVNHWADRPIADASENKALEQDVIKRLVTDGVFAPLGEVEQ